MHVCAHMCMGIHVYRGMSLYVRACMCTAVHVRDTQGIGIPLQAAGVGPAGKSTTSPGCLILTISLTASEGKDEGFGSPGKAWVLPNGSETRPEVQPEACAGSRR